MSVQTIEIMASWVRNNIGNSPSLEEMAAHVGYSPYYCSAKFREYFGITYKQHLAKCKLETAVHALTHTADSITAIAFRCGYHSSESLARACAQAYGCTPSALRSASNAISE